MLRCCCTAAGDVAKQQVSSHTEKKVSLLHLAVMSAAEAARLAAADAHSSSLGDQRDDDIDAIQPSGCVADTDTGMAALHLALKLDVVDQDRVNAVYRKILNAYRTGEFGRYTFDTLA